MFENTRAVDAVFEDLKILKTDNPWMFGIEAGDFFYYFCGDDSERTVIGEVLEFIKYYPFDDSEDDEYVLLPTVDLWVEVANPPKSIFRKVQSPHNVLLNPEFGDGGLDLYDRHEFTVPDEGRTYLSEKEADLISYKSHDHPFHVIRRTGAAALEHYLSAAAPLAPYQPRTEDIKNPADYS